MSGKEEIKILAKAFKDLTTKMQRDSQNESKVISHFSQIINTTEKTISERSKKKKKNQ